MLECQLFPRSHDYIFKKKNSFFFRAEELTLSSDTPRRHNSDTTRNIPPPNSRTLQRRLPHAIRQQHGMQPQHLVDESIQVRGTRQYPGVAAIGAGRGELCMELGLPRRVLREAVEGVDERGRGCVAAGDDGGDRVAVEPALVPVAPAVRGGFGDEVRGYVWFFDLELLVGEWLVSERVGICGVERMFRGPLHETRGF